MEKDDKGSTLIRIGVSGESSFWYRPTRVVPDQRPLNGRCNKAIVDIRLCPQYGAAPWWVSLIICDNAKTMLKQFHF